MTRNFSLTILAVCTFAAAVQAQAPRFHWQAGQVLTYRVSQSTEAVETVKDQTLKTTTKLDLVKRWQVIGVDDAGTATIQMSLASLRMENLPPSGEAMIFDSANPAKSHEQLRDEMAKYVGPPLVSARIDNRGQLVEVKECKFGPESRLQCDLPFKLVLPADSFAVGKSWERTYQIKLDPPQGTGEKYEALQKFTVKPPVNGLTVVGVSTTIKDMPAQTSDQVPLLPMLLEGDVYFHESNGRYYAARLKLKKELVNHAGEGTKYVFESSYQEDLQQDK
jgi:hypothetical protein